ncbi:MAG: hypothetical protein IPJ01_10330 [Micavibrio sp.]|nr:hypothetical protein [Micavibrio sp.]
MEKETLLQALKHISDVYLKKKDYISAGQINRAMDVVEDYDGVIPQTNVISELKYTKARFLAKEPNKLHEIITLNKWYTIYEKKDGEVMLCLDNEFSHWIPNECLELR